MDIELRGYHPERREHDCGSIDTFVRMLIDTQLQEGEKYIIDNGHLVAWNCNYVMERVASGGIISGITSGEGLVCKFSGPGTIFLQTRNPGAFSLYLSQHAAAV